MVTFVLVLVAVVVVATVVVVVCVCVCVCVCVSVADYLKQIGGSGSDPVPDEEVSFHLFMEACGTLALALALA